MQDGFRSLVDAAAERYRAAGRTPYHFARGKLGRDPVFAALLGQGLIADGTRLVDLGCGQGVLLALLAAADDRGQHPRGVRAHGVDLRADAIDAARVALGPDGRVDVGDLLTYDLPSCDVVTIFDVLHYIERDAQRQLLARVYQRLSPGGRLLLRTGDAAQGWRFRLTLAGDWMVTLARGRWQRRFFCRTADQWRDLLRETGFAVDILPMSAGTPFANVLLIGDKPSGGCSSLFKGEVGRGMGLEAIYVNPSPP